VCSYEGEEQHPSTYNTRLFEEVLNEADKIVGHNLIGFDCRVLDSVWNVRIPRSSVVDTLYLSRLYNPSQDGGHSLRNWGTILGGTGKLDFTDYDGGLCDEMIEYCIADVELTEQVHKWLELQLRKETSLSSLLILNIA
jgi:hypothetical protein